MFAKFKSIDTLTAFAVAIFLASGIIASTYALPSNSGTVIPALTETPTPTPTPTPEESPAPSPTPNEEESPTREPTPYVDPTDPRPVPPVAAPTVTPSPEL